MATLKNKWSKEQISTLIDAYREQTCLYAVKSANYHNKRLRAAALQKVREAVCLVRPGSDEKDCQNKFHNLRNQFNIENAKRKCSIKSGAGTDDMYVPNLWYFKELLFLEEHCLPRKSKISPLPHSESLVVESSQIDDSESLSQILNRCFDAGDQLRVYVDRDEEDGDDSGQLQSSCSGNLVTSLQSRTPSPTTAPLLATAVSSAVATHASSKSSTSLSSASTTPVHSRVSPPIQRQNSTSGSASTTPGHSRASPPIQRRNSASGSASSSTRIVPSNVHVPPTATHGQKRKRTHADDAYVGAIESIAECLRQPMQPMPVPQTIALCPVDACMNFLGSILKSYKNEALKLEVMNTLVQTVINAKAVDSERGGTID